MESEKSVEFDLKKIRSSIRQKHEIDKITRDNIDKYSNTPDDVISEHLRKLDEEWDIDRSLEVNMSALALAGILLSLFVSRKWLILPTVVLGFFLQKAFQKWSPPVSFLRGLKFRTRSEIDQEKYGLKALRGDFVGIDNAEEAMKSVQRY